MTATEKMSMEQNERENKKMTYYQITADFNLIKYAMTFIEAEQIAKKWQNDGLSFITISMIKDFKHHEISILKTYC